MTITDLTPFSGTKPNKDTQSPEAFDTNVQNWVDYTTVLPDEINDFIDELAIEASNITTQAGIATTQAGIATDSAAIAVGAANYQGLWSSLTGAYSKGISVGHSGFFWVLNVNLADITTSEPSYSNNDWLAFTISLFSNKTALEQAHAISLYF